MILDRTIAPPSKDIEQVHIPKAQKILLDNQIPLYIIEAGEQAIMRLELIYDAGSKLDIQDGNSYFVSKMLTEGTKSHKAADISEHFDQYGAFIEISQSADRLAIAIHGMSKHLPKLLPMVKELITEAVFPEKELSMQKNIASQSLKINLEKTAFVASQTLRQELYGAEHYYGKSLKTTDIEAVTQNSIINFYEQNIKNKPFSIFLSGKFEKDEIASINDILGKISIEKLAELKPNTISNTDKATTLLIEREENMQSSIRLGKILFNRSHPDFFKFVLTNTIFGGYFGSRLMKNIREEKGFTYGISSSLIPNKESGYLVIGTDVKKEFTQQTIDEVYKEIKILQTELVSESELSTAKNYLIGSFIGSLNTPFEIADRQKIIVLENLSPDFYKNYVQILKTISATDVMEMANKYYQANSLQEVVVGGK